jgi:hypothetical protein
MLSEQNNTFARFVTKLPETIRLQGQYEMALVEIIYPHNSYNVTDENKDNYWIAAANKDAMQKVYLFPGYYEDGNALVEALKFAQDIAVKFSFNRASCRISLNFSFDQFAYDEDVRRYTEFYGIRRSARLPKVVRCSRRTRF